MAKPNDKAIKNADRLLGNGNITGALAAYQAILETDPDNAEVLLAMGQGFISIGDFNKAATLLQKACGLAPENAKILIPFSRALAELGHTNDALALAEAAIGKLPDSIEALENSYEICSKTGKIQGMITCLERLCSIKPQEKRYYSELTGLYGQSQHYEKAFDTFKKYGDTETATAVDYAKAGENAYFARQAKQAIDYLNKSLTLDPTSAKTWSFLAHCHSAMGNKTEAIEALHNAIKGKPPVLGAYFSLAELKGFKKGDAAFSFLETLKGNKSLDINDQTAVGYGLGRMYHGIKEFDKAFYNYALGNAALKKQFTDAGNPFIRSRLEEANALLFNLFSNENLKKISYQGSNSKKPVFIIGLPRSGTTLLEQIIAAHTEISSAGELKTLTRIYSRLMAESGKLGEADFKASVRKVIDRNGAEYAATFLKELEKKGAKTPLIIDKMPQNFMQLGLINILFPNAKIIHLKRHPMDVGLSIYRSWFSGNLRYAQDLSEIGFYIKKYQELMAYWLENLSLKLLDVDYAALVNDPEGEATRVLEFCGLDWQPECLEFYKNRNTVFTASNIQVRKPITTSAVGKWKAYEKHLKPLKKALEQ